MLSALRYPSWFRRIVLPLLCAGPLASLPAAEPSPVAPAVNAGAGWDIAEFIDGLPDLLTDRLPGFDRTGALRLYVRPHFGDLLRRDYLRVPFGGRAKVSENIESSAELQT